MVCGHQAGLAEAHHRLRTFKNSVSSEVQGVTNTEDGEWVTWEGFCGGKIRWMGMGYDL